MLHAHVVQEDEALDRQSLRLGAIRCKGTERESTQLSARSAPLRDKKHEVGKGLSLADTQTGR